tara:strand:- start:297 stop:647 length:351 start_codon:yes stop_codon:yes gene_type:complete
MITLTSLEQIQDLSHSHEVRRALAAELLMPFGTLALANVFWLETSTILLAVLPDENVEQLLSDSSEVFKHFTELEFITELVGNWYLTLIITSQDGGGRYLLFPSGMHSKLSTLLFT